MKAQAQQVTTGSETIECIDLPSILGSRLKRLPYVVRLLCENHLRSGGNAAELCAGLDSRRRGAPFELIFQPNRLLMHDTTGTPALADIAALGDVLGEHGVDPSVLSPKIPVDVSVDHSLAVNAYARPDAQAINSQNEIRRNSERYAFMKWAAQAMENMTVHPPATGIMHTVNLEQLSTVMTRDASGLAHPDMMLGTDSHTPMVNGIGALAWGIGGLEAESIARHARYAGSCRCPPLRRAPIGPVVDRSRPGGYGEAA